jgi:hypothetical protein
VPGQEAYMGTREYHRAGPGGEISPTLNCLVWNGGFAQLYGVKPSCYPRSLVSPAATASLSSAWRLTQQSGPGRFALPSVLPNRLKLVLLQNAS